MNNRILPPQERCKEYTDADHIWRYLYSVRSVSIALRNSQQRPIPRILDELSEEVLKLLEIKNSPGIKFYYKAVQGQPLIVVQQICVPVVVHKKISENFFKEFIKNDKSENLARTESVKAADNMVVQAIYKALFEYFEKNFSIV